VKEKSWFRVDIFARDAAKFRAIENECKELITGAGGSVLTEFVYPGGFMYVRQFLQDSLRVSIPLAHSKLEQISNSERRSLQSIERHR